MDPSKIPRCLDRRRHRPRVQRRTSRAITLVSNHQRHTQAYSEVVPKELHNQGAVLVGFFVQCVEFSNGIIKRLQVVSLLRLKDVCNTCLARWQARSGEFKIS